MKIYPIFMLLILIYGANYSYMSKAEGNCFKILLKSYLFQKGRLTANLQLFSDLEFASRFALIFLGSGNCGSYPIHFDLLSHLQYY